MRESTSPASSAYPPCRICGSGSVPVFMNGAHRFYRCMSCRTAFVSPVPSDEFLANFYNTYHLSDAAGGLYDAVEARMQADFHAKIALVRAAAASMGIASPRVLDVGCGKGYFVRACVDAGLDAEGVDLSETGVEFARKELGVKATAGLLAHVKSQLGLFDLATFWATIEHLPDPIGTIRDIGTVLKPRGRLLLDTGIGDDELDRLLPGHVQWYDAPQHLFVFSDSGMRETLRRAGFNALTLDPCFERSNARRVVRKVRNGLTAVLLRGVAEIGRLRHNEFVFTRFPIGNLMSVQAEKVLAP